MQSHDEAEAIRTAQRRAAHGRQDNAGPETSLEVARAVADPANASPGSLMELQRLAGNASVSRMISSDGEQEAGDRSPVLDVVGGSGGSPLEPSLRQEMESRLGADFGDVRVHSDGKATESARSVQANAYTVGNDVVFQSDQWSPSSQEGKHTLAHELTHVMQQRAGPVAGTEVGGGIKLSSPADEFEQAADASASAALAAPLPAAGGGAGATAQRQSVEGNELPEEEEMLQGSFVQRQAEEEEELPAALEEPEEEELQASFIQRQSEEEMLGEEEELG